MSNSSSHPSALIGGRSPANDHDVIDSPDRVSRVTPPSTTMEKVQAAQKASHFDRLRAEGAERPHAMPASGPRSAGAGRGREAVEKSERRGRDSDGDELLALVVVDVAIVVPPRRRAAWDSAAATNARAWCTCFTCIATPRDAAKEELDDEQQARREAAAAVAVAIEALVDDVAESIDELFASA